MEVEQVQAIEKEKEKENLDISNLSLEDQDSNDENNEPTKNKKVYLMIIEILFKSASGQMCS